MRQAEYDMGETRSALGVICSSYDEFFEAEKKIADYMMEHKAEVVDMTVGEQGQRDQRRHRIPFLQAVRLQRVPQPEAGIGQGGAGRRTNGQKCVQ